MRRTAPSVAISPRLLKHFAAATLAITTCIAIFADGSTTEAVAETVKQNELKKTEIDMLAARGQTQQGLKVRSAPPAPVEDPAPLDNSPADGSFYDGPTAPPAYMAGGNHLGGEVSRPEDLLPGNEPARRARQAGQPRRPAPAELARLHEASRLRTGSTAVN